MRLLDQMLSSTEQELGFYKDYITLIECSAIKTTIEAFDGKCEALLHQLGSNEVQTTLCSRLYGS